MQLFRQVPFAAFDHQPDNWQGTLSVEHTDHQRNARMTNFATIHHKYQRPNTGQSVQELPDKRQVVNFKVNLLVLDPATVALDPALWLGSIRRIFRNVGQLATLALHDATNQGCHGVQVASQVPFRRLRIKLLNRLSNGTIDTTVVTHGYSLSFVVEKQSVPCLAAVNLLKKCPVIKSR